MTDKLNDQQIREAHIRMEGSAEKRREILARMLCAYCGKPCKGNFSIHRDDSCTGPEFPLCDECGDEDGPSLSEIRRKLFMQIQPIMDMSDEISKLRWENQRLSAALDRATDQLVHAAKTIAELESALKVKLF